MATRLRSNASFDSMEDTVPVLVLQAQVLQGTQKEGIRAAIKQKIWSKDEQLLDCILTLEATALCCLLQHAAERLDVALAAPETQARVNGNNLSVILLEEIHSVVAEQDWLIVNYVPSVFKQWSKTHKGTVDDIGTDTLTFRVKLANEQECADVMSALLAAKARLLRHLQWLRDRLPLLDRIFICSISAQLLKAPEVVLARVPAWNSTIALPPDWCRYVTGEISTAPSGSIYVHIQTPLGYSKVRLTAAKLRAMTPQGPDSGHAVRLRATPCRAASPDTTDVPKACTDMYDTGAALQAMLFCSWVNLSDAQHSDNGASLVRVPGGAEPLLPESAEPLAAAKAAAKDEGRSPVVATSLRDSADAAPPTTVIPAAAAAPPQLSTRHILIALSFVVAVLAIVIHHFFKAGKLSSGILLVDIAAGVSLCGMAIAALPILAESPVSTTSSVPLSPAASDADATTTADTDSRSALEHSSAAPVQPHTAVIRHNSAFVDAPHPLLWAPAPEWGLVVTHVDIVERDVHAEAELEIEESAGLSSDGGSERGRTSSDKRGDGSRRSRSLSRPPSFLRRVQSSKDESPTGGPPTVGRLSPIDLSKSDSEGSSPPSVNMPEKPKQQLLSLFQEPAWQPPSVSKAFLEDMVQRFYEGCRRNVLEAKRRLLITKEYREKNGINQVLETPQPHFFEFKRVYEHGIYGRTRGGFVVTIDRAGGVKKAFNTMLEKGIDKIELKKHIFFLSEYYNIVDPRPLPGGRIFKVLDVAGLGMYDVFGQIYAFLSEVTQIGDAHYPERLHTMVIVNAPAWINMLWKSFASLMDESTRNRIKVTNSKKKSIYALLSAEMDDESIPKEWGGQNKRGINESEEELELADFVRRLNRDANIPDE